MIRAALTHDVEAERRVGDLSANIHNAGHFLQDIEVLAERFPTKVDTLGKNDLGNVLDSFH